MLQVKGNQPSLYLQLQEQLLEQSPLDEWQEEEKGYGRHTHWYVSLYNTETIPEALEWKKMTRFIHVHRACYTTKNKKWVHSDRLYITDLTQVDAQLYGQGIRAHWGIENQLHYVKDVFHGEDHNGINSHNGAVNCSTISTIALNIHRKRGEKSIKDAQAIAQANTQDFICEFLT